MAVGEDLFSLSTENSKVAIPYKNIFKVKSDRSFLLVYINQYFYYIIPKSNDELGAAAASIERRFAARFR